MSKVLADAVGQHAAGALAAQRAVHRIRSGEDPRDVSIVVPADLTPEWVASALRELLKAVR